MRETPTVNDLPEEASNRVVSWLVRVMIAWGGVVLALLGITFFQGHVASSVESAKAGVEWRAQP